MIATALAFFIRLECATLTGTDFDCARQWSEDYGSYEAALEVARTCGTPTAWVSQTSERPAGQSVGVYWVAQCGTEDGLVCGEDLAWNEPECDAVAQ